MTGSELLRERRESLGLSQGELADQSMVNRGYIWQIENRRRNIGHKTAMKLAPVLGVRWQDFFPDDARSSERAS